MELKVLGCHGGETPRHRTSSFLLDGRVAIDAGAITSMLTLPEQQRIEAVLVSHAHLDHVRDLATLADNRCQQGGPTRQIVGTPATLAALRAHFFNDLLWPDFSRIKTPAGPTLTYVPVEPEHTVTISGLSVRPIMVNHTIETAAFLIDGPDGAVAYSGDTGPTDRLWQVLNECPKLLALMMEVSFPNAHGTLARLSGHHTPATLTADLAKLTQRRDLPVLLYHIKPFFEAEVERELSELRRSELTVLRLGDQFLLR